MPAPPDPDELPVDVATLRRLAAWVAGPPSPLPWRTAELTAAQLDDAAGVRPPEWDPVEQPSREAFDAEMHRRGTDAAWRGLVAADGRPVVGQPLRGGSPRDVVDPAWRMLAETVSALPRLLAAIRQLWPTSTHRPSAPTRPTVPRPTGPATAPAGGGHADAGEAARLDPGRLAAAAQACFDPAGSAPHRLGELSGTAKKEWHDRAAAAVAAYLRG